MIFIVGVPGQSADRILEKEDLYYLQQLTKAVLDSSRIFPGATVSSLSGRNNTGGVVIRPGGKNDYPAFWIRDYAMALETGMITTAEQKHLLLLTAGTQCDQTWITKSGALVPFGAIADHIRVDNNLPIYFPGTYDYEAQGDTTYGMVPPYCDQFYFIYMAHHYVKTTSDVKILSTKIKGTSLIDRLAIAFRTPPSRPGNALVYTTADFRGVDFGFRDGIRITGDLCFTSILKYKAALDLAELFSQLKDGTKASQYSHIAGRIKEALPVVFKDSSGLLRASTGWSSQADVWASALAIYFKVLDSQEAKQVCTALNEAYSKGDLSMNGNVRHVPVSKDFSETTAWEKTGVDKNRYQNGAYWGTLTGWVCYAISQVDRTSAKKLAKEFIKDLRENDFRKGGDFGAPYECFYPPSSQQNPLYLATVACPYIVFKSAF